MDGRKIGNKATLLLKIRAVPNPGAKQLRRAVRCNPSSEKSGTDVAGIGVRFGLIGEIFLSDNSTCFCARIQIIKAH